MKLLLFILAVKKITLLNIKQYLERKGWQVFFTNTPAAKKLIDTLGLADILKNTDGLAYKKAQYKFVFINGCQSETDQLFTLLHESAHIYLHHDLSNISKADEAQAWQLAYSVFNFKKRFIKSFLTSVLSAVLLVTTSVYATAFFYAKADTALVSPNGTHYHRSSCRFANQDNCFKISEKDARKYYVPCSYCNPK